MQIQNKISKHFTTLVIIGITANALGLFTDIIGPDGALYATISKYIAEKNDWINLFGDGREWLDKPHFPFWITALSYKVFGANAFAYKLPSFLCFLIGCFYTYKLSFKIFNKQTAELATVIYVTALHTIICNFDVRAEGYLTAFVIASMYYLYKALFESWFKNIFLAALFTAFAIMTKGIFVLITINSGFVVYWVLSKQYKEFLNIKWYVYVALSFLFIVPELYCLYSQFDAHPEKIVFGQTHFSGIKFFFWDSQFGRFFNTGPIQGSGDLLFFLHTTLWAFLPWSIYLAMAIFKNVKTFKAIKVNHYTIIYSSAWCSFLLFSISKFQLPHYIVIVFPLLAIVVSRYLICNTKADDIKLFLNIQNITLILLSSGLFILSFIFKLNYLVIVGLLLLAFLICFFFILKQKTLFIVVLKSIMCSLLLSVFINIFFYPQVLQYQADMMAGKWQKKNLPNTVVLMYKCNQNLLEIYGNSSDKRITNLSTPLTSKDSILIFTPKSEMQLINKDSFKINSLQSFPFYGVTQLEYKFINSTTRYMLIDSFVIASIKAKY